MSRIGPMRAIVAAMSLTAIIGIVIGGIAIFGTDGVRTWIDAYRTPKLYLPEGWPQPRYAIANDNETALFELGRQLFHDPQLSKDGSIACNSCHQQFAAFAHFDHRVSHGIGGANGKRNAPGLFNLAWQPELMWDGAVNHLELQPLAPLLNPVEMAAQLPDVLNTLRNDTRYPAMFKRAYGSPDIDSQRLLVALARFMEAMISADSRYDRYRNGHESFTADETAGLAVFRERCAGCHTEPLFSDFSYRSNGHASDDIGRAAITARDEDRGRFRVPSLRNLGYTAPYMHDGRYYTLVAVIDHYARIFGRADLDPLLRDQLPLRQDERSALLAFLATLDDETFVRDRRFAEPRP